MIKSVIIYLAKVPNGKEQTYAPEEIEIIGDCKEKYEKNLKEIISDKKFSTRNELKEFVAKELNINQSIIEFAVKIFITQVFFKN